MSLPAFIDYLTLEKHYSKHTVTAYSKDIESFQVFVEKHYDDTSITGVNYSQIRSWIVALVETKISNRSINRKISSLQSYYKFLLKVEDIQVNPLAKHNALKTSKKIQVPFSEAEVNSVLDGISHSKSFEGIRNKLIIELFYSTGMRRIELIELRLSSIDFSNKTVKVLGKQNKERYIPLLESVILTLHLYLEQRQVLENIKDSSSLFLTKKGVKIYETLVYRVINEYFSEASLKAKKSPHILRHSFATHLLTQGANLNAVKELLGHASLAATQVYLNNNISELKKVYSNAHPRSKK
ncbi:tyrosine-type recombinase/integrase [Bizionia gelidisalsuginis]|uniref:Tyrosine-type recombinase/integrase n=2 Tax=Bizionia TaxID=283785 RepID=A0A8H2LER0_9FLAO|nr:MULTISPECIES: tyrosine-type recombinase/integrase [Bizionia]TYB74541.1 tyrosine-type recombinase/integrase [Bizionia saleffrena]TYC16335.1 tyrosine-type recombinase/integrase [Bizionia gelidisalsuginis]